MEFNILQSIEQAVKEMPHTLQKCIILLRHFQLRVVISQKACVHGRLSLLNNFGGNMMPFLSSSLQNEKPLGHSASRSSNISKVWKSVSFCQSYAVFICLLLCVCMCVREEQLSFPGGLHLQSPATSAHPEP